jgi:iron complex transport system permease protein
VTRLLVVTVLLATATFLVFCIGIAVGDYPLGLSGVVRALAGHGDRFDLLTVRELRLPRALVGLLVGAAFGMSGAVFQTITRNPLASPDMIGIAAGASTAAVLAICLNVNIQTFGLVGAFATAALIYLLAWRHGATGYRIVLIGVGVTWLCTSATSYLLSKARLHEAQQALGWLVGSVNNRTWSTVPPLVIIMAAALPVIMLGGRWLRTLQLGDEVATGLGTPVRTARLVLLGAGVVLVAFGTSATGPIAFVALAAPQIAQRLAGLPAPPPLASGLTGSLIVLAADLVARRAIPDIELPVGVVTGAFGAPFLLWLLITANRRLAA